MASSSVKPPEEREVKVVLLGESGVGKSSIALRFVNNNFKTITASTIGASFLSKVVMHQGIRVRYNIWDTAGQEKYRSLAAMYYKGAECAIIAYDISNRETFIQAADYWIAEVIRECGSGTALCVAANKADLASERQVSEEEGRAFAQAHGASYFETSAKADQNIQEVFRDFAMRLPSNESGTDSHNRSRSKTYSLGRAANTPKEPSSSNSILAFCC